jgi:hypothetical protein
MSFLNFNNSCLFRNYHIILIFFSTILCISSCQDEPVKPIKPKEKAKPSKIITSSTKYIDSTAEKSGLQIKWAKKGTGSELENGDVVLINYVVSLPNGKLVDGSSKITKSDLPFMVGYNIQNKGWDMAMRKMKVGDVATVIIPAELGWSDKSLGEVLPANSDLIVQLFIVKKINPATSLNGSKIWRWSLKKNEKKDLAFGPNKRIKFHLLVNSQEEVGLINTYAKNSIISNQFEDEIEPASLKKALTNAKKGQGIFILVSPQEVAKIKGIDKNKLSNNSLLYSVQVLDVYTD